MSFFFGKGSKTKPQFTGLQAQTSPIPRMRMAAPFPHQP